MRSLANAVILLDLKESCQLQGEATREFSTVTNVL